MTANVASPRAPARRGSLRCKSGPIYTVSFSIICRHNLLTNRGLGLMCLHFCMFIETPSLEGLLSKAKKVPSTHKTNSVGHQPSISWSLG